MTSIEPFHHMPLHHLVSLYQVGDLIGFDGEVCCELAEDHDLCRDLGQRVGRDEQIAVGECAGHGVLGLSRQHNALVGCFRSHGAYSHGLGARG